MKVIDFETIRNMGITPLQCYEWVSDMLTKKNETILPAKISMKPMNGVFYNVMPTVLLDDKRVGVKVVTRYPERNPSLESEILLYNLENGELLAILDGTYITAMRTGAVAAHSIKLLAKKDFKTLGFMGLGNTARATMKILEALFPDREMTIKLLKYKNQHEQFKDIFSSNKNLKFEICDTCQQLVKGSDVIVSAVTVPGCLHIVLHTRFLSCHTGAPDPYWHKPFQVPQSLLDKHSPDPRKFRSWFPTRRYLSLRSRSPSPASRYSLTSP